MGGTPKPPDPNATAEAQAKAGQYAAGQNFWNQNVNEFNPYGSKTYAQTGTTQVYDPFSKSFYDQPQYTSNVTLSPAEQNILDLSTKSRTNLGELGVDQSARMKSLLSKDIDLTTATPWMQAKAPGEIRQNQAPTDEKAVQDAMMERYKRYADPQNEAQNVQLAMRGLNPGSQGAGTVAQQQGDQFSNATREAFLASGEESRRNQAAFNQATGDEANLWSNYVNQNNAIRQGMTAEEYAKRNQSFNEMGALAGLSSVNNPTFSAYNPTSVGDVPIGQYIYDDFNARSKQASDKWSGIASIGSAAIPLFGGLSDRRAKHSLEPIGQNLAGVPLYVFKYWDDPHTTHVGVMADEARLLHPDAVHLNPDDGYDYVDYGLLRRRHAD